MMKSSCTLCHSDGGRLLWKNADFRVVVIDDPDLAGYIRVIANRHIKEMTDCTAEESAALIELILKIEQRMRTMLAPDKINLASLGNITPHLHWHVIARWTDDAFFPDSIWSARRRESDPVQRKIRDTQAELFFAALTEELQASLR
jgi:diadenosine tetraphosphate (Ap4A) HIT family hydrolase